MAQIDLRKHDFIDALFDTSKKANDIQAFLNFDAGGGGGSANIWSGTQEEYDALTTKDPDTAYFIYDDGGFFNVASTIDDIRTHLTAIEQIIQAVILTKQDTLTFDDYPTQGSENVVTSDGIYSALTMSYGEEMTMAEYNALSTEEKMDGKVRYITDGGTADVPRAEGVAF